MSEISLTANVYFVGPVTQVGAEDSKTFYFPCVFYKEFEQDGEDVYYISRCWFIAHEHFTKEELARLQWGDRVLITAGVGECGLAISKFQERNGWHISTIKLLSRNHTTFEDTDVPIPQKVSLPHSKRLPARKKGRRDATQHSNKESRSLPKAARSR